MPFTKMTSRREFLKIAGVAAASAASGILLYKYPIENLLINRFSTERFLLDMELESLDYEIKKDETKEKPAQTMIDDGSVNILRMWPRFEHPHQLEYVISFYTPAFYVLLDLDMYGREYATASLVSEASGYDTTTEYFFIKFHEKVIGRGTENPPIDMLLVPQFRNISKRPIHVEVQEKWFSENSKYTNEQFEIGTTDGKVILYQNGETK